METPKKTKIASNLVPKNAHSFSPHFLPRRVSPRREHRIVDVEHVDESRTMLSTSLCRPAYKMEKYGLKPPPSRTDS